MRTATLATAFALALVAGCASAPPPRPAAPMPSSGNTVTNSRAADFAAPPTEGGVQFVNVDVPKQYDPTNDDTPATKLRGDSQSSEDVKNVHLSAAKH